MNPKLIVLLSVVSIGAVIISGCGLNQTALQKATEKMEDFNESVAPRITPTPTVTTNNEGQTTSFYSDGDLISGWYWLRDENVRQYAEWTITDIPRTGAYLVLDMNVLATDTFNGRGGEPAEVTWYAGDPANKADLAKLYREIETIPNTSPASDPLGYTCEGKIYIPHLAVGDISELYVRVERSAQASNHVAVNAESIKSVTSSETGSQ